MQIPFMLNLVKKRVEDELDKLLEYGFFERSGGGIGMTRMISCFEVV